MIDDPFDGAETLAFFRKWLATANFDPVSLDTLTAASMALTAAGAGISAAGTIAGGNAQRTAAAYQATQLRENASTQIGAAQRQALDERLKSSMLQSTTIARAAASGVNAGFGSPLTDVGNIAQRGEYNAAMDLWRGKQAATGDINQATAAELSGKIAQDASYYTAAGTIAGAGGSMLSQYGAYKYPTVYGRAGVSGV